MAKKKKGKHEKGDAEAQVPSSTVTQEPGAGPPVKMKRKEYERQMRILHGELVAMQEWVKDSGAKVCVVFEGRDTAGKGGTIKRITERVSPRVFRVVALPTPTEREKSQMYVQRYARHFPAAGEVVIFDRSWYNRAGVERVMGFCRPQETERFLELVPAWEKAMADSGILLLKYWLEVSPGEQTRRLEARINDPRKVWKLSPMDLRSYGRWYDYSRARDAMFAASDTAWGPWYVADADDKKRARLNIISHLLSQVPTSRWPAGTPSCPNGSRPAATYSRTCPCGTSPHRSSRLANRTRAPTTKHSPRIGGGRPQGSGASDSSSSSQRVRSRNQVRGYRPFSPILKADFARFQLFGARHFVVSAELVEYGEAGGQAGVGPGLGALYRAELPAFAAGKAHRTSKGVRLPLMLAPRAGDPASHRKRMVGGQPRTHPY